MPMILDGHTHIFPEEVIRRREDYFTSEPAFRLLYESPKSKMVGPEEMLAAMEDEGVEAAVILGFPWRQEGLCRRHNDVILEAQRRWPRKFFGFCAAHPARPGGVREIERCLAAGARGIGELAFYLHDRQDEIKEILAPVAELCQHYKAPLMLHATDRAGSEVPGPLPHPPGRGLSSHQGLSRDHLDFGPLGRPPALLRPAERRRPPRSSKTSITTPPPRPTSTGR